MSPAPVSLTPASDGEGPQVVLVRQEGHEDETMEVQPLHQDPVMICCQEVQEESNSCFTASLMAKTENMSKTCDNTFTDHFVRYTCSPAY